MADLTYIERANIEKFLGMRGGYVMDFSDRTFQEFVGKAVGLDIDNEKYHYSSNSKANRLRQFIKFESNYTFGKLLSAFCDYWLSKIQTGEKDPRDDKYLYKECIQIAERLKQEIIENLVKSYRGNEQLIKSEEEREKLLLENVRTAVKEEIKKQAKKTKKHEALEKKIEEVTKFVTDHIIKGNSVKLLSAPEEKVETIFEKEDDKEELFIKNKVNYSKLDAATKQLLLDTYTTIPKPEDYEKE